MATYNQWSFVLGSSHRGELQVSLLKRTYENGREIGFDLVYLSHPLTATALRAQVSDALDQALTEWFDQEAARVPVTDSL